MPAKVILDILAGPMQGKVFEFDRHDTFLLGRKKDCHVPLGNDGLASRHHFLMEVNPPDARLRDLGSRNGTYVNGVKWGGRAVHEELPEQAAGRTYPEVDLKDGDRIAVGGTTIRVRVEHPLRCARCQAEITAPDPYRTVAPNSQVWCDACRALPASQAPPQAVVELATEDLALQRMIADAVRGKSQAGLSIRDYELADKLGQGGMGAVYRAVRKSDGKSAAVKVMLPRAAVDPLARQRFLREIGVTGELVHPNVVRMLEHGVAGEAFYFVMELCSGGSVDALMGKHGGKLPVAVAAPIMRQCLDGLEHAHRLKFIHRDLKPQNVLLDQQPSGWIAKISDFGLAKNLEQAGLSGMTATGGFSGTYPFMPREQLTQFKYFLPVSDLWSMAATFYNMLTGKFPLDFPRNRDPLEVLLRDEPVPICRRDAAVPKALAAVLDRALLSTISQRYQTATELKLALHHSLALLSI